MGVHKNPETSIGYTTTERGPVDCLHRRHPTDIRLSSPSSGTCSSSGLPTGMSRVHHQHRKVRANSNPEHRILGALSKLHRHGATTPPTQNKTDSSRVSKDNEDGRVNLSPYTSTATGENELNSMCNSPCTSLLQKSTDGTLQHSGDACPKLRRISNLNTSQFGRAEMVGHGDVQVEWEDPPQERDRHGHRLRCITAGMGSLLRHPNHKGSVVTEGGNLPHQLSGIAGSHTSSSVICKKQIQIEHPAEDRQHHSSSIYQPSGGDNFKRLGQSDEEPVDVVPGEEHTHHSPTPPRVPEHHCGCRITVTDRQDRLEAVPSAVPPNTANIWPTGSGPLCNPLVCSVPSLLQLAARSVCRSNRCISPSMDPHQGICQSTLESGGQSTCPSTVSTSQPGVGSTSVEIPTMVPHTTIHVGGLPQTDNIRNRNNGQQRQLTDAPTTSRMAHLRERYKSQQLSEEATDLMLSSWRTKTNKSYDSLFAKWHRWCSERSSDPFSGPIARVANFLPYLYKEGYKYSSVNAYRSAISSVHEKVDGYTVGQHPLICRLVKGVFQSRPPLPRYTQTWDVQKVLNYLDSLGDNQLLSLKHLTWKVTMLLALSRPSRSADLSKLDISKRVYKPDGVCFYPNTLAKQSRSTSQISNFFFLSLPEGNRLCPVSTLKEYESRTQPLRGRETNLLIAIIKPHKAVSSSTVARWLKLLLEASGIDTSIFGAHSVRGASSSAAASAGISTSDILKAAGWSSESTFQRFYYKPLDNPSFGRAVLNQPASNNTVDM
ncbi:uncharacterized protein [Dysidea avara]|uniref:uncharacterized protein n=1 Tax=Dysidea avara TaxID=196820 RepID=UPI003326EDF7